METKKILGSGLVCVGALINLGANRLSKVKVKTLDGDKHSKRNKLFNTKIKLYLDDAERQRLKRLGVTGHDDGVLTIPPDYSDTVTANYKIKTNYFLKKEVIECVGIASMVAGSFFEILACGKN